MIFYVLDYLGYVRAAHTCLAEFRPNGRKQYGTKFPLCPICGERIGSLEWQPPFEVILSTSKLGDLCTDGLDILVSKRFCDAWDEYELAGLVLDEHQVKVLNDESLIGYYRVLKPPHTFTVLNNQESGLVEQESEICNHCHVATREKLERIRVNEKTWSGFDIFRPSGLYGKILVTERVVKMVGECQFSNFHFIHQDEYHEPRVFEDHAGII